MLITVKALGKALLNPYLLGAVVVGTLAALVIKTRDLGQMVQGVKLGATEMFRMLRQGISPLTELFNEWGEAMGKAMKGMGFSDDRAFVLGMMQEMGAIVSLIVYAVSSVAATILRLTVDIATVISNIVLGEDLQNLIWAVKELKK